MLVMGHRCGSERCVYLEKIRLYTICIRWCKEGFVCQDVGGDSSQTDELITTVTSWVGFSGGSAKELM